MCCNFHDHVDDDVDDDDLFELILGSCFVEILSFSVCCVMCLWVWCVCVEQSAMRQ